MNFEDMEGDIHTHQLYNKKNNIVEFGNAF